MEQLHKKLDDRSYEKLTANLIDNVSLWQLNEDDLLEMGIIEKGPRKIILNVIERHFENIVSENVAENGQNLFNEEQQRESIRSILAKEPKFLKILTRQLDCGIVPEPKKMLYMNRILTKHFFEHQILREKKYPTWQQKQDLAIHILDEFPQLENTCVSENAPKESYFFWKNGGLDRGPHTGLIETRVSNMRKDLLPEDRLFRRTKKTVIIVEDELVQLAAHLAALIPTATNARQVAEGMAQVHSLHKALLQENNFHIIVKTFPHLLAYEGEMIIQAFDRIQTNIHALGDLQTLLRAGLLFDNASWSMVEDDFVRGALRLIKKLSNRGIKRTTVLENASMEEIAAAPLIRWKSYVRTEIGFDEKLAVQQSSATIIEPHIICIADRYKRGNIG
ncbi:uncharacterized protein LOC131692502 isoform X2 [Topomyia yanbarensis]|uniref:uncharacterized protein LOC131676278 isoform X2 n=1 Tax=Topomyia yanbarensis TaxID=2498891 RepID=UPI00273C43FF|nr:uncharacterized protein LOC131676278 isoform X2 [Topomyia yanbarensis]XP_058835401.1 uncharacterized protein LOC131692399 isoform X2 [Topomyia yanbarensis]XP_058835569.1 uncharacterized protein LOC131692502 isoform X2 [Topomyia yanbarensis]